MSSSYSSGEEETVLCQTRAGFFSWLACLVVIQERGCGHPELGFGTIRGGGGGGAVAVAA